MPLEVIGAGLGRTGTASLRKALETLYDGGPCYHMDALFEARRNGEGWHCDFWRRVFRGEATAADWATLERYVCGVDYVRCLLRAAGRLRAGTDARSPLWLAAAGGGVGGPPRSVPER